ncbi:MAG: hypothetical protein JWP74_3322 [Marmoricola sp.]|nr:hypothetical protein [Marmoricola sp.]
MSEIQTTTAPRRLGIAHLVLGLIFLGISAVWAIGQATNADLGSTAVGFPAVLILAGLIGLAASVVGSRRRAVPAYPAPADGPTNHEPTADIEDTAVLSTEEQS